MRYFYFRPLIILMSISEILEYIGFICSLLYVFLLMRNTVWAWPFGIIGSAVMGYTFVTAEQPLYMETVSYLIYTLLGFYGLYHWLYGNKDANENTVTIIEWSLKMHTVAIVSTIAVGTVIAYLLQSTREANPFFDSYTTSFAILGTWLQARKVLSSWIYWLVINAASIVLYAINGFYPYVLLMMVFTVLSVLGFVKWKKIYNEQAI